MKLILCTVLAIVCVVGAQHRCSTPPVWEGMFNEYLSKQNVSIPWGKFSYDASNQRMRTLEIINANGTSQTLDILYYRRCKTVFIFNVKTKKCQRLHMDMPWRAFEIPETAKFLGFGYLGTAGIPLGGLEVQTWVGEIPAVSGLTFTTTFTKHGCLPITFATFGEKYGITALNMYNLVLGIQDPNVFRPRKECFEQNQVLPEDLVHVAAQIPDDQIRGTPRTPLYRLIQASRHNNQVPYM